MTRSAHSGDSVMPWRIELHLIEMQAPFENEDTQALSYTIVCDNADDAMGIYRALECLAHSAVVARSPRKEGA